MDTELFNLSGKTALVTGGSRGIGLALAEALARHGADICLLARDPDRLTAAAKKIRSAAGTKVTTFSCDLENAEQIEPAFEKIISQVNQVDILVNCAGLTIRAAAENVDLKTWNRILDVNLRAAFFISQAFCRHRKALNKPGRIINVGSLMCAGARPDTTPYAVSKGGLLMLTRSLAVEWAKYNINVNAVGPGYIATDLTEKLRADESFNNWVLSKTPLNRWGQPADLVGATVFFASPASDFITGQIIYVDGGWLAAL